MTIHECDDCGTTRPGCSNDAGFFCHICRGDMLDPYCEIDDAIDLVMSRLAGLIRKAETVAEWTQVRQVSQELAPLLALRMENAT